MKNIKVLVAAFTLLFVLSLCSIVQPNKVSAASNQIQDVTRIGGANRFETSVEIAKQGWTHSDNAVLADAQGNDAFADAISGTSLAYYLDCPILLTNTNNTPNVVKDEISQLGVKNIYILGGTGVISNSQEDNLKSNGYNVTRIAGLNRFDTACKAADILNSKSKIKKVYIASADKFQYPLIAAPYAARENGVVLFTDGSKLDDITKNEILKLGIKDACVVGSSHIISYNVDDQLKNLGVNDFRIESDTPQSAASNFININGTNSQGISVVSDTMFPDALSSSVLTAKNNYNILLVGNEFNYTINDNVKHAFIFGGTGAVSQSIENYIKNVGISREISNDQIYQLFENSQIAQDDIMLSGNQNEEVTGDDGKVYLSMPEQYNSYEKVQDILSNYYTKEYLPNVMGCFSAAKIIDGKLVVPADANVGMLFDDTTKVLTSRQNIDSNSIQVTYNDYGTITEPPMDTITVILSLENNKWKISNIKWINN